MILQFFKDMFENYGRHSGVAVPPLIFPMIDTTKIDTAVSPIVEDFPFTPAPFICVPANANGAEVEQTQNPDERVA